MEIKSCHGLYLRSQYLSAEMKRSAFEARLEIIGINPFVSVPEDILSEIFKQAGKEKGHIPVCGTVNGRPYTQTLVRYSGAWRFYVNTMMLDDSPGRIGETISVEIAFDPRDRTIVPHPGLLRALEAHPEAAAVFESLPPSRRKEIVRYIANLRSEESRTKNIAKAIGFLKGENRFVGRDKP